MKLTQRFEELLEKSFAQTRVIDENGDGHHVEIICIDDVFIPMSRLEKSRYAFEKLSGFIKQVHAVTVKCFSEQEWEAKKDTFTPTKYVHIKKKGEK